MLAVGGAACSDQAPQPSTCGPPGPAFDVSVQVPDSHLPADLTVTALYGAGEETYRLSSPAGRSEVLFCSPQSQRAEPGGDAAGAAPNAEGGSSGVGENDDELLRCELWTDSSVTFRVVSARYLPIERELEPTVDRCGMITTDVTLELEWLPK